MDLSCPSEDQSLWGRSLHQGPNPGPQANATVAISANPKARHKPMMMVFFMEITSFLLGFSILSVPFLTSEEKMVDKILTLVILRMRRIK